MKREYHVAVTGCDFAEGTAEHPFRTINKACLFYTSYGAQFQNRGTDP